MIRKGIRALQSLSKLVLPGKEAEVAVQDLMLMGISPRTVYPGYSGIADHVLMKSYFEK
jgi:hypothetical protein